MLLLLLCHTATGVAATATRLSLNPGETPPGTFYRVTGSGFGASEIVRITLRSTPIASVATGKLGGFTARLQVPASTLPGGYRVSAVGRRTGRTASALLIVRTSWNTFQFAIARSGWNPYENVLSSANVATLGVVWGKQYGGEGSPPVVSKGRVYNGEGGNIAARAASDGHLLWMHNTGGLVQAPPTVSGNSVVVGGGSGIIRAYRADTGALIWAHNVSSEAPLAVANGRVFVTSANNRLYALSLTTGGLLWSRVFPSLSQDGPAVWRDKLLLYAGTPLALDQATGKTDWQLDSTGYFSAPTIAPDGTAYWEEGHELWAINADTGAVLWHVPSATAEHGAVANGVVYMAEGWNLVAYSTSDGHQLWSVPEDDALFGEAPIIANGVVYVGTWPQDGTGSLIAVDPATGAVLLDMPLGSPVMYGPVVVNGRLLVTTYDGKLRVLAPS